MKIKGLRWWIIGLVALGTAINYLARSSLSVAASTLFTELHITEQQYSWVIMSFQMAYTLAQSVCGYILDSIGLRIGFFIFALAWSFANMAHALAINWQSLAFCRGLLGLSESAAIPAGIKATSEWFLRKSAASPAVYSILGHPSARCWRHRLWYGRLSICTGSSPLFSQVHSDLSLPFYGCFISPTRKT